MLHSAGLAVQALTGTSRSIHNDETILPSKIEQQRQTFQQAASQYFALLSSVDVRLRRQIYALEEAEIIPAEAPPKEQPNSLSVPSAFAAFGNGPATPSTKQVASSKAVVGGVGMGSLDVGWLNSRNDDVGKEKEAELWAEAERFMANVEKDMKSNSEEGN